MNLPRSCVTEIVDANVADYDEQMRIPASASVTFEQRWAVDTDGEISLEPADPGTFARIRIPRVDP